MKILVADDEQYALDNLVKVVREVNKDAEIIAFNEPEDVVDYIKENSVDVAFLDIEMGSMTGIEVAKQIKLY